MSSFWNHLRARTCEAVLAGISDALEDVEKGDRGSHHLESSPELVRRLSNQSSSLSLHGPVEQASEQTEDSADNQTNSEELDTRARSPRDWRVGGEHDLSVTKVEGIGAAYAAKIQEAGIESTQALLAAGASTKGRKAIAAKTGISGKLILKWVNRIDLSRVRGIGEEYADLLEIAGVDTVPELAQRRADHLHKKLVEVNEERKLVRRIPSQSDVSNWIEHAKELPRAVTYGTS